MHYQYYIVCNKVVSSVFCLFAFQFCKASFSLHVHALRKTKLCLICIFTTGIYTVLTNPHNLKAEHTKMHRAFQLDEVPIYKHLCETDAICYTNNKQCYFVWVSVNATKRIFLFKML